MGLVIVSAASLVIVVQASQATITGVVRAGDSGEPLAGATVSLPDVNRRTLTDANGRYVLPHVLPGPQHLTIRFIGHTPRTVHALVPPDGELEINVTLRPLPIRLAPVAVRQHVVVRGTDPADSTAYPDRGITIAEVRQHPGLAEPDVLQALGGGHVVLAPEAPSGVHIRGGTSDQTAYLLDGIPIFSPYHAAGLFGAWNPDAIERVRLSSVAPPASSPDALSGVIEAITRDAGDRAHSSGAASTSQARVTLDGPLGDRGASYLVSLRTGFPGPIFGGHDPSYVRGETGDWLVKLGSPALGGQLRLLAYGTGTELGTTAQSDAERLQHSAPLRNVFDWYSSSIGAEWRRAVHDGAARLVGWRAKSDANARWAPSDAFAELTALRRDVGVQGTVEHHWIHATGLVGVRVEQRRTFYRVASDSGQWEERARAPLTTAFANHTSSIGSRGHVEMGAALALIGSHQRVSPRIRIEWMASDRLSFSGGYAELHQFAQSLRNSESLASTIFPADLYVSVGAPGMPVARSDQAVLSADYRPFAGTRLGAQIYTRHMGGVIRGIPRMGEPFASESFEVGGGSTRGLTVDLAVSTARTGFLASYALQRVRLDNGPKAFVPEYGATQLADAAFVVYPTSTWSVRLAASGAVGRRATAVSNGVEWESCNLLDGGCEFVGSPRTDGALGKTRTPAYARVDLGLRKHWHVSLGDRELLVGAFGTVTNLFDRRNVLTYARTAPNREPLAVVMRPIAPLVVGLDWQF